MKKRAKLITITALVLAAGGYAIYRSTTAEAEPVYRFATVERGDLEASVSATGTLSAVTTVQVGTQVSGRIVELMADFNDRVKKGQLVARIDPTLLEQAVRDAQANYERAVAELEQAQREYDRNQQLFERKVLTEIEFNNAKYALAVARANVKSAQVAVDRARQNLSYTSIFAPIDGIVVERNVDVGQTVTASMSTPQLFLIANDLTQMQILASVDESDIGAIRPDQNVRFTVQAFPDERFVGRVKQVRLQSKTQENVVNYTVVVSVSNPDGRLLPGMTATVDFLTGTATDALMVPNAALRFRPTDEMRAQVRARLEKMGGDNGVRMANGNRRTNDEGAPVAREGRQVDGQFAGPMPSLGGGGNGGGSRQNGAMLWYLDEKGQLNITRVQVGITDGQHTVIEGPNVREGMQVIVGVNQPTQAMGTNPFQPGGPGIRRGPAGF